MANFGSELSTEKKKQVIIDLIESGLQVREVSKMLNVSERAVSRLIYLSLILKLILTTYINHS